MDPVTLAVVEDLGGLLVIGLTGALAYALAVRWARRSQAPLPTADR